MPRRSRSSRCRSSETELVSGRPLGNRRRNVVLDRWSALFTDATDDSRSSDVSAADHPSTSRSSRTARWRGGSSWIAAMNASWIASRVW